jgi:hypothetical protein
MVRTSPRLAKDVDLTEEMELRRLEGTLPMASAPAGGGHHVHASTGATADVVDEEATACDGL